MSDSDTYDNDECSYLNRFRRMTPDIRRPRSAVTDREIQIRMGEWISWNFAGLKPGDVFRFVSGDAWNHKWEYRVDGPVFPTGKTLGVLCSLIRKRWTWTRFKWWVGIVIHEWTHPSRETEIQKLSEFHDSP